MPKTFCVVGTDARQRAAARTLAQAGFRVLGAEGAGEADYILLPVPLEADAASLARILRAARPGTLALGGKISAPVQEAARTAGVELIDYFLRPELELLNAVPTAEGCVALLMQLRDSTVWESDFLILGYGRVGRAVACRLAALEYQSGAGRSAMEHAAYVIDDGGKTFYVDRAREIYKKCCGQDYVTEREQFEADLAAGKYDEEDARSEEA